MYKIITPDALIKLRESLDQIDDINDLLHTEHILIDDKDIEDFDMPEEIITGDVSLRYDDTGISKYITLDPSGAVYLDNDLSEYDVMFLSDLKIITDTGTRLKNWYENLPNYQK